MTPLWWQVTGTRPGAVTVVIDPRSPVFPGHYPGRPLVPGVCLIDLVQAAAVHLGLTRPPVHSTVDRARFLDPVRPGDTLEVAVEARGDTLVGTAHTARGVACRIVLRRPVAAA